ncbi:hypothetical protein EDD17DRAFT_1507840 [Pisolithus thermaeus]|nr:hypothetical protein EDD17DRAFT_1507840 [Pisolithus thermaeus]
MDKVHATLKRKLEWVRGGVLSGHVAPQGLLAHTPAGLGIQSQQSSSRIQEDQQGSRVSQEPGSDWFQILCKSHPDQSPSVLHQELSTADIQDVCPFVPEIFKFNIKEGHDLEQSSDKSDVDEEIEWGVLENEELCDKMIEMVEREDAGWLPEHLQWRRESSPQDLCKRA